MTAAGGSWYKAIAERGQVGMCLCVLVLLSGNSAVLRLLCIIWVEKARGWLASEAVVLVGKYTSVGSSVRLAAG